MPRRIVAATIALALLAGTAACANTNEVPKGDEQITIYRGRDLPCRVTGLPTSTHGYDCNFALFYANPSGTYPKLPRIDPDALKEQTTPYRGSPIHCLVYDASHQTTGSSCDFERWKAEGGV